MRFERGYLRIGAWRGVPILIHWSTPLIGIFFSGGSFEPGTWLGVVVVIIVHELGHAVLVRSRGLRARAIEVHALGGRCQYEGPATPLDSSIIAWGGVLFQALLAVATLAVMELAPVPTAAFTRQVLHAFVGISAYIMVFNLLPIPGLDGWEAWRLFGRLPWKKWRSRIKRSRAPEDAWLSDDASTDEIVRRALDRARAESRARRKDELH